MPQAAPTVVDLDPHYACAGGLVTIRGTFLTARRMPPTVMLGDEPVRISSASPRAIRFRVPAGVAGVLPVRIDGAADVPALDVAHVVTTGVHQVDNPAFDASGRLYVTYSGARGEQVPVSIFRVSRSGARESFSSSIVNPTALAFAPDGVLYVSSRFEGVVYRVDEDGTASPVVTDVGVACGLAFDRAGVLYIGDRSGTIFRVRLGAQPQVLATLPPSVAAFHLAVGSDECLYVTAPTLTSYDRVYRIHPDGRTEEAARGFGRPQGLAFDADGQLHVVDALAGASGLYRVSASGERTLVVSGDGLLGVAFDPAGALVLASNDTIYRFDHAPHTARRAQ